MKTKEKLFDVAIIECGTGRIETIIGKRLDQKHADKRLLTGLSRINAHFFVDILPAGQYKVGQFREGR